MKIIKLISGLIIGFFSTTTIIEMFHNESGAGLYGALTGYIIIMAFSIWLVFSSSRESNNSNLKVKNDEKDLLAEENKERLLTLNIQNLKRLKENNILTQEEYDSKLSQIAKKDFEEKITKTNEYALLKNLYDSGILSKIEFEEKTKILIEKQSLEKTYQKDASQSSYNSTKEIQFKKSTPIKKDNSQKTGIIIAIVFISVIIIIGSTGGFKKSESEEESFPNMDSIPIVAVADTTSVTEQTTSSTIESPESTSPVTETEDNQSSKMTVKALEGIVRMSYSSFEDWALSHNYIYEKTVNSENCDFIYYKIDDSKRIIYSVSKNGGNFGFITFATNDLYEFKDILNKCEEIGYKSYIDLEKPNNNESNSISYRKGSCELTFSKKDEFYLINVGLI